MVITAGLLASVLAGHLEDAFYIFIYKIYIGRKVFYGRRPDRMKKEKRFLRPTAKQNEKKVIGEEHDFRR